MRVGRTIPADGTVFDWDIAEILTRWSVDLFGEVDLWEDMPKSRHAQWLRLLDEKRQDEHYPDILRSISEYGFTMPCTAYSPKRSLWFGDGHHRLAAAIDLGMTTVPVRVHRGDWDYDSGVLAEDSGAWTYDEGIPGRGYEPADYYGNHEDDDFDRSY